MDIESRKTIHAGVNFVLAPMPVLDSQLSINFQRFLAESDIEVTGVKQRENELVIVREGPSPLNIKIALQGPTGQFLIVTPFTDKSIEEIADEAGRVVRAFEFAAEHGPRQIIMKDATIRDLYEANGTHSFQEIWEGFLGQRPGSLQMLQKQVLGGGLRFVMPPAENDPEPVQIELKIESYLRDTSKIYFEAQFTWPQPSQLGEQIDPNLLLMDVDEYIRNIADGFAEEINE